MTAFSAASVGFMVLFTCVIIMLACMPSPLPPAGASWQACVGVHGCQIGASVCGRKTRGWVACMYSARHAQVVVGCNMARRCAFSGGSTCADVCVPALRLLVDVRRSIG